jgi:hypothetical protein
MKINLQLFLIVLLLFSIMPLLKYLDISRQTSENVIQCIGDYSFSQDFLDFWRPYEDENPEHIRCND